MKRTHEEFMALARAVYEQARDEAKSVATLTIASALLESYSDGVEEILERQQLAIAAAAPDQPTTESSRS